MFTNETEAEKYRKESILQANHIELLKTELSEMTDAYYALVKKYKEKCEEVDRLEMKVTHLKQKINIETYWGSDSS